MEGTGVRAGAGLCPEGALGPSHSPLLEASRGGQCSWSQAHGVGGPEPTVVQNQKHPASPQPSYTTMSACPHGRPTVTDTRCTAFRVPG